MVRRNPSVSFVLIASALLELGGLIAGSNFLIASNVISKLLHFGAQLTLVWVWHLHLMTKADQLGEEKQFMQALATVLKAQESISDEVSE
ncbi:MAG TPA: hypothetical protein VFI24_28555 [Pyrinomonadaceae bacterium]|nr:hypothetical protein [Pyrinomonadaceae bacterium]